MKPDILIPIAPFILCAAIVLGCKSPPPDRNYATVETTQITATNATTGSLVITNYPLKNWGPRPAPVAPPQAYRFHTNSQQDRLVEHDIMRPPALPGMGPIPVYKSPPSISNWMTKAMVVQPKPMGTNQIPGSTILTKITTTGSDGKPFTAELTLEGNQTIQANDRMAVVIFSINTTNWIIESCTNLLDGKWYPMASGTGGNTNNGALILVDLKEDSAPIKFYLQKVQ